MNTSALAATLFIGWALLLLLLMETVRSYLVVVGQKRSNEFTPDNSTLSPFMQRLARAHANCVEGFPILAVFSSCRSRPATRESRTLWPSGSSLRASRSPRFTWLRSA